MHINDIAPFKMLCAEFYERYRSGIDGLSERRREECKDCKIKTIEFDGPGHPVVFRPLPAYAKTTVAPHVWEILKKAERLSLKFKAEDEAREQNS